MYASVPASTVKTNPGMSVIEYVLRTLSTVWTTRPRTAVAIMGRQDTLNRSWNRTLISMLTMAMPTGTSKVCTASIAKHAPSRP